jgi:hypothetical protein
MKKLLLVMLVPVLVLGVMSCGKLVEGSEVDALAGTWEGDGVKLIIAGNQASVIVEGNVDADEKQIVAKFRIDASINDEGEGDISFNSFDDKKAKELGTVKFAFTGDQDAPAADDTLEFSEAESDTDNFYVKILMGEFVRL